MTVNIDLQSKKTQVVGAVVVCALAVAGMVYWLGSEKNADDSVVTEVPVQVGKVHRLDIHAYVTAYGSVETQPAEGGRPGGGAKLSTSVAGTVLGVPVTEGQSVKAGQIIVRLDSRVNQAAMDKARASLSFAEQQYNRQEKILEIGGTSQKALQTALQQLDAARADVAAAQGALAFTQLASPVDGVVARINVNPGQTVDTNTVVAEIVDLDRLIVTVSVPAPEASNLKVGDAASISPDDNGNAATEGNVSFVSPTVDSRTNTALVRIAVRPHSPLRPGETVIAKIVSETHKSVLAVPFQSVVRRDGAASIYVVADQIARQKAVQAGVRDGDYIEVQGSGVQEGQIVVTVGAYGLPAETKIKAVSQ